MNTLAARLKESRQRKKMTQAQVADKVGMSQPNYAKLERGLTLETSKLYELAQTLSVSYEWLKDGIGDMTRPTVLTMTNAISIAPEQIRQVPILNTTQAGDWRTYFDQAIADTYEPLAGNYGSYVYGLLLDGDSMLPEFKSGDVVFIDPDIRPSPGDFVVAMCELPDGYATTFKKYRPRGYDAQGNEYFELVALNEDYGSYDSRNIKCTIIGTAVLQSKRLK